jgi:hypothetical protein
MLLYRENRGISRRREEYMKLCMIICEFKVIVMCRE